MGAVWAAAATVAEPGLRVMLRRRLRRGKELAGRLEERRGIEHGARPSGRLVWLHAASVGETQSVLPLLRELAARGITVLMTTGTVTSARLLEERCGSAVLHRFVPLDVPRWVARFLDHWRPQAAVFVESELWPNMLAACAGRGIPLMLVNARMSASSLRRWRLAPGFAREIVGRFARVHPQSAADAERLAALGARLVDAPGNLKLAAPPLPVDGAELERLRGVLGARPAWLAASTHPGEEAVAASVHAALAERFPGLVTVIVPRHPERGAEIAAGAMRRAAGQDPPAGGIWVADTLGELGLLYRLIPIVFIGKSLVGRGGQNPWEPARLGCAVAAGPHMANFSDAASRLSASGALATVHGTEELAAWVGEMLSRPAARDTAGKAAAAAAQGEAGLAARLADRIVELAA